MTQKKRVLKALATDTIVESIFEIRFQGTQSNIGDILSGLIYQKHKLDYPNIEKLPISHLPVQLIDMDPSLRYQATNKFTGNKTVLLIGGNVLTVSKHSPYEGWTNFKKRINKCLATLDETKLVKKVERIALRYTNFAPADNKIIGKDKILFSGTLGKFDLTKSICHVRTEVIFNDCLNIVQVTSNAELTADKRAGIILDIDTQLTKDLSNFWSDKSKLLEKIHSVEKEIFLSILTNETLQKLWPTWS